MKRRAELRRFRRFAANGKVDPRHYAALDTQRILPEDHPMRSNGECLSSREQGMELLDLIRRAGAEDLQHRLHRQVKPDSGGLLVPRPGPESMVTVEMLLLAVLLAAKLKHSYKRSDLSSVLTGLNADVALAVGLIDEDGNLIIPRYKVIAKQMKRLEDALRQGWTQVRNEGQPDEVRINYNLQWFVNLLLAASIPEEERQKITHVVMDDTDLDSWAAWIRKSYEKDAEKNEPYVAYSQRSPDDPNAADPAREAIGDADGDGDGDDVTPAQKKAHEEMAKKRKEHLDKAISKGLDVGPDGRVIYTKDADVRAGHRSATATRRAGVYKGYVVRIAVACATVNFFGDLDPYPHPKDDRSILKPVTTYITSLIVDSAGTNPGPAGVQLVEQSREIAPNIVDATADRGFTMKPGFLLALHKQGINVFMDYPKTVVERANLMMLAKGHEVYMHCGTILPTYISSELLTPPEFDKPGRKEQYKKWYTDRATTFRYSLKQKFPGGNMQFRTPIHAGRITNTPATMASGSYNAPKVTMAKTDSSSRKTVMADVELLNHYQRIPYHTPAWHIVYPSARNTVESAISTIKEDSSLDHGTCKAMGLAANTLAALARILIVNLAKTEEQKPKDEGDSDGDDCTRPPANPSGSTPRSARDPSGSSPRSAVRGHKSETQTRAPP